MARPQLGLALVAICAITAGCYATDNDVPTTDDSALHGAVAADPAHRAYRPGSETLPFQAEVNRMMDILIHSLYSNKDIFLRELISNAADALDKIRFLSISNETELSTGSELGIKIWADPERRVLSIRDTGVGMTREELIRNLGTVARSGTSAFLEQLQKGGDLSLIGQFGVGFYSVYLVADYVEVITKHNNGSQMVWESSASGDYAVGVDSADAPQLGRGTQINLHLKPAAEEYLDAAKLRELVERYSEFISFPISLRVPRGAEEPAKTEDEEDEEEVEAGVAQDDEPYKWEVLNAAQALWLRSPGEVKDAEYDKFYTALAKAGEFDRPLARAHFRAEGDVEFRAVLYVPGTAPPQFYSDFYHAKPRLKLYVRRVLIGDSFPELLPRWLSFLVGLVDSDSLPLNVSREVLQLSHGLKVIRKKLVRKALDMIRRLSDDERAASEALDASGGGEALAVEERDRLRGQKQKYETFWAEFGRAVKMGVIEETTHRKRILPLLRFATSASVGKLTSLRDYVARMKEEQKGVYYVSGLSPEEAERSPFADALTSRGYEVIYFSDPLDGYVMSHVTEYEGHDFINAAKDDLKLPEDEATKKEAAELKREFKPLLRWWKKLLLPSQPVEAVRVSTRVSPAQPCLLAANKFGWSAQMERLAAAQTLGNDPAQARWQRGLRVLEINPRHPLVRQLRALVESDPDSAATKNRAMLLYEACALESGYTLDDVPAFVGRVRHLLADKLGVEGVEEPLPPASSLDAKEEEPTVDGHEQDDVHEKGDLPEEAAVDAYGEEDITHEEEDAVHGEDAVHEEDDAVHEEDDVGHEEDDVGHEEDDAGHDEL